MSIAGSDYTLDFTALSDVSPWTDAAWSNIENSAQISTSTETGIRANGFAFTTIKNNTTLDDDVVKSKVSIVTNAANTFDSLGPMLFVASGANLNHGYRLHCDATAGVVYKRTAATGGGSSLGTSFTFAGASNGDEYEIWYTKSTGEIAVYRNNVEVITYTDTDYDGEDFNAGIYFDPQNNNGRRIGEFGADGIAVSGPTVDSITDPIIGTEPVTIVLTEADASIDTIEFTAGTVTQAQSFTTSDDTELVIATPTRNLLPPIGTVTVSLKDGATEITSTTATLQEPAGWGVQVGSGIVDEEAVPHTGTLVDGMIAYWDDYPNTLINAAFSDITQVIPRAVNFYIWDPVAEEYGTVSAFTYNAGTFTRLLHAKPIFGKALIARALQASAL